MPLLIFFLLLAPLTLSGCAGPAILSAKDYQTMASRLPAQSLSQRALPNAPAEILAAQTTADTPYGQILFKQLAPNFMQERAKTYYLGETFAETIQPRRSTFSLEKLGFTIEHVSQRVKVKILGLVDWDGDGTREWLVMCEAFERRGGREITWYLLVKEPEDAKEILTPQVAAIWDCQGGHCVLTENKNVKIIDQKQSTLPPSEVEEFRPGEQIITTPTEEAKPNSSKVNERSL